MKIQSPVESPHRLCQEWHNLPREQLKPINLNTMSQFSSVEICAGAGGQALGLEQAGFEHTALVEYEKEYCSTLRLNRPHWDVYEKDVREFSAKKYKGISLLAGGVPCLLLPTEN